MTSVTSPRANYDVLIVGAGHAGAQAATMLRQRKFAGSVAIIGAENEYPYERPPLSKEYLSGEKPFERILIRPAASWAEREIDMLLGRRVDAVDIVAKTVLLSDGTSVGYERLIWAAGGAPRRLTCTGNAARGVHSVRSRADVDRMIAELPDVRRVVVIGGGYIGLEAAAVLAKLGKQVIVLEAQDRVLARVAGEPLSRFFEAEHRAHGVDVRLNVAVSCVEERDGAAVGVRLVDDDVLPCEMVIVGIGIEPSVGPMLEAGVIGGNGVNVDDYCRTSAPDIFAIGDCAAHTNRFADGRTIRLESVQNANDQAITVAKILTSEPAPYDALPWFWSNQYDLKLQTAGLSTDYDQVVVRGDMRERSFSVIYLRSGRVIALDCVNATKDYVQGRSLVTNGAEVDPTDLSDIDKPLKSLMPSI